MLKQTFRLNFFIHFFKAINDKRPKDIRSVYGREYWNKYSECPGK